MWHGHQYQSADPAARAAGCGGRPHDSALAGFDAGQLSAREIRHRARDLDHDLAGRPGGRPGAGRLYHRQHLLGLDLLHQRAGRTDGGGRDLVALSRSRIAHTASAGGFCRPGVIGGVDRRFSGHARQGQGTRLVRVAPDHRARYCRVGRLRCVSDLGTDRPASGGRFESVCESQFRGFDRYHLGRLRGVLR